MIKKIFIDIEAVKKIMQANGIDEKELALLTGYTLRTIRTLLNGKNECSRPFGKLFILARILNVPSKAIIKDSI